MRVCQHSFFYVWSPRLIWPSIYFYTLFVYLSLSRLPFRICLSFRASFHRFALGKSLQMRVLRRFVASVAGVARAEIAIPHCHTKWRASGRNNRMALHFVLRAERISRRDREFYLFSLTKYVKLWAKCLDNCKYFIHPLYSHGMLDFKRWRHTYI